MPRWSTRRNSGLPHGLPSWPDSMQNTRAFLCHCTYYGQEVIFDVADMQNTRAFLCYCSARMCRTISARRRANSPGFHGQS